MVWYSRISTSTNLSRFRLRSERRPGGSDGTPDRQWCRSLRLAEGRLSAIDAGVVAHCLAGEPPGSAAVAWPSPYRGSLSGSAGNSVSVERLPVVR
jgi:hypothetical protein